MSDTVFECSYWAVERTAAVHAARTIRRYNLPKDAQFDLQQDALLELWRKRGLFDDRRAGWLTFSDRVVANHLRSRVRSLFATRRNPSAIGLDEAKRPLVVPDLNLDVQIDVARVLRSVSGFDRRVAIGLTNVSISEISHELRVARTTVYRAVGRLRAAFIKAGFSRRRFPSNALGRRKCEGEPRTEHRGSAG
jgi:DNA-directed RNA polymerase specialized sigma24 family protein